MPTQAKYRLFAGVTKADIDALDSSDTDSPFLDEILNGDGDFDKGGLTFTRFRFNDEFCAIGVQIQELDWSTEITESNKYDLTVAERAQQTLAIVDAVFQENGVPLTAELYHYLDLE